MHFYARSIFSISNTRVKGDTMKFSDKIRENIMDGWSGDAPCLSDELAREAADLIDNLITTLKVCDNAFGYLGIDVDQISLAAPRMVRESLIKAGVERND